jgi:hypothetical protein
VTGGTLTASSRWPREAAISSMTASVTAPRNRRRTRPEGAARGRVAGADRLGVLVTPLSARNTTRACLVWLPCNPLDRAIKLSRCVDVLSLFPTSPM